MATARKLTIDAFDNGAEAQPDDTRHELLSGEVIAQSVPVPRHARVIVGVMNASRAGLPGAGVRVADDTALIPDLSVFCSRRIGDTERWLTDLIIHPGEGFAPIHSRGPQDNRGAGGFSGRSTGRHAVIRGDFLPDRRRITG